MDSLSSQLSASQWIDMFILAMGLLVLFSLITMITAWSISAKLSDIKSLYEEVHPVVDSSDNSDKIDQQQEL